MTQIPQSAIASASILASVKVILFLLPRWASDEGSLNVETEWYPLRCEANGLADEESGHFFDFVFVAPKGCFQPISETD